ncbi:MAG: histidinol dehydrogenase [Hydrogenophilus sp.]|nr:histidinol dehydrogenase [Hydrogenophilus sp.]
MQEVEERRGRMQRLEVESPDFEERFEALLRLEAETDATIGARVAEIVQRVRSEGDRALLAYTARFDGVKAESVRELRLRREDLAAAWRSLPTRAQEALQVAVERVRRYHERQVEKGWWMEESDGTRLGLKVTPLERVGLYVPGGRAAYPSSVVMNAVPARVAGVRELVMVTPTPNGERNRWVLAAAYLTGVDEVFLVGGAQAVAALAFGTESVPRVDKIVGPGNAYVAEAKRQLYGRVGIDMVAGPSEVVVLTDGSANAKWVAADLLAQAEHDELAQAIVVSTDRGFLDRVEEAIAEALPSEPRRSIIEVSLAKRGALIYASDRPTAVGVVNRIAPEHLELAVADPERWEPEIHHAGAIFMGHWSVEALGDYCAGPNHVLPTMGSARFSSPLGVWDFVKRTSLIQVSRAGAARLGAVAAELAEGEGLWAHARSARLRVEAAEREKR